MTPGQGEAAWTEEDRVIALVWQSESAAVCPGCGLPSAETCAPENEDGYTARKIRCHACAVRDRRADGQEPSPGAYYVVERVRG